MAAAKRRKILAIVATDATFERVEARGETVWAGKCLHCNRTLLVALDGEPISAATIEHIVPRSRGGTDDVKNLALACAGCNASKGIRHDWKPASDQRASEIVDNLLAKRRARWRDPPEPQNQ